MSRVSTDPISDMLTRIRNAILVNKSEVSLPYSKVKESVARILAESNFISGVSVSGEGKDKILELTITESGQNPRINEIDRISKPGRRSYTKASDIPIVKRGRGMVIISTSKGVMSGDSARENQIGGELICRVY